jgi:hypothetical protein
LPSNITAKNIDSACRNLSFTCLPRLQRRSRVWFLAWFHGMALDALSKTLGAWQPSQPSDYLAVSALLALPFVLTYILTYIKGYLIRTSHTKDGAREPPPAPYAVPGLANTIGFARDPEGYLRKML